MLFDDFKKIDALSHDILDAAIFAVHAKNAVLIKYLTRNKRSKRFSNTLFDSNQSPHQRLLSMINTKQSKSNYKLGIAVLGELLGNVSFVCSLDESHQLFKAITIFLKFKIYGKRYISDDGHNNTCLHDALALSRYSNFLIKLLLQHGADIEQENDSHFTALTSHIYMHYKCAQMPFVAQLNSKKYSHKEKLRLVIYEAIFTQSGIILPLLKVMELFNIFKIYPDLLNFHSRTPLHIAAELHSKEVVDYLLRCGADPRIKGRFDRKPIDVAVINGRDASDVVALLLLKELNYTTPQNSALTAQQVVTALLALDMTNQRLQVVCHALFELNADYSFTLDDLLSTLENKIGPITHDAVEFEEKYKQRLGSGGSSTMVYKGYAPGSWKCTFAVKLLDSLGDEDDMQDEINIHRQLNHHNIIKFVCEVNRDGYIGFAMEYADVILSNFVFYSNYAIVENKLPSMSLEINAGLQYIHDLGYVHKDIKMSNIFLKDGTIKIADVGASGKIGITRDRPVTTITYRSPEAFDLSYPYATSEDTYSFGVVLGEMGTQEAAWRERLSDDCKTEILSYKDIEEAVCSGKRTTYANKKMLPSVRTLMEWCCEQDPKKRPDHENIRSYLVRNFK